MSFQKDIDDITTSFYNLQYTYATPSLLNGDVDINTVARKLGKIATMIEWHYCKLATERLNILRAYTETSSA